MLGEVPSVKAKTVKVTHSSYKNSSYKLVQVDFIIVCACRTGALNFHKPKPISRLCLRRDAYIFLPLRLHRDSIDILFSSDEHRI